MTLPQRLRKMRKGANLTPTALSRAAGVGHSTASMLEAGVRLPRLPIAERIADVLHVSAGWLAFGADLQWVPREGSELRCMAVVERARLARGLLGLSQREVDRRASVATGTSRSLETGTMPTIDTLELLANALGVSSSWLAFGEGPRELRKRRYPQRGTGQHQPAAQLDQQGGDEVERVRQ